MKQVRRYLITRDKKIIGLLLGSENSEPLAPKEIAIKLNVSKWVVYRTIYRLIESQRTIPKNNLVSPDRRG